VLLIKSQDRNKDALVPARVTRALRESERSFLYVPQAEDEYDEALQAIMEASCSEAGIHLQAADGALRASISF
jgi:hypothetical protein